MENVCVLTNFRTGSTSFTLEKSEEHQLPYKGEMFSHEIPFGLGELESIKRDAFIFSNPKVGRQALSRWNFFQQLRNGHPACYKIMPNHFGDDKEHFQLRTVISQADKIYYLYRRDFMKQIESWVAARLTGSWAETGFKAYPENADGKSWRESWMHVEEIYVKRMHGIHRGVFGDKDEPYKASINPSKGVNHGQGHDLNLTRMVWQLVYNYKVMGRMWKEFPGELVCYEDYFQKEKYKPYNREITWESELDMDVINEQVDTWDIESYFK